MEQETKPDAEWLLKEFMLSYVVEHLGITEQQVCSHGPNRLTDPSGLSDEEIRSNLWRAIKSDALCSFAWFNLGADFGQSHASTDAFRAYLFAGITFPQDIEAWCRALLYGLASASKDPLIPPLFICAAQMAYRRNGHNFLTEMAKLVEQQSPTCPKTELMNLVADAVKDIDRANRLEEVRLTGEGANYRVIFRREG